MLAKELAHLEKVEIQSKQKYQKLELHLKYLHIQMGSSLFYDCDFKVVRILHAILQFLETGCSLALAIVDSTGEGGN